MAASVPYDAPPPYSPNPPPVGFESPAPNMKVDQTQQGYGPVPFNPTYAQPQGSVQVVTTQPAVATQPVVVMSGAYCPGCRAGILQNEFTCCGIFLAILCFPVGLICCFLMMDRRCSNCRASYGSAM